jgi:hypothetical protein
MKDKKRSAQQRTYDFEHKFLGNGNRKLHRKRTRMGQYSDT